jgi:hypothetical protein
MILDAVAGLGAALGGDGGGAAPRTIRGFMSFIAVLLDVD